MGGLQTTPSVFEESKATAQSQDFVNTTNQSQDQIKEVHLPLQASAYFGQRQESK